MIGEICATQKFLKQPISSLDDPAQKSVADLKTMLQELEAELAEFN